MPQSKKDVQIRSLNWLLPFGKHKGQTIKEVLEGDPRYIEWAVNERIFVLDEEADNYMLDCLDNTDYDI